MSEGIKRRRTVLLSLPTAEGLLELYVDEGPAGGFEITGRNDVPVGELVDLEVVFSDVLMVFRARGIVRERRLAGTALRPAGMRIELLPSETRTRNVLLDFARGKNRSLVRRRARRYPIQVEVEMAVEAEFKRVQTDDINREGAFILTDDLLNSGTLVAIRFYGPGNAATLVINAEVVWRQLAPRSGIGVRFLVGDAGKKGEIEKFIDKLTDEKRTRK